MNASLKGLLPKQKSKNNLWNNFGNEKIDTEVDPKKFNIRRKSQVSLNPPKSREQNSITSDRKLSRRQSVIRQKSFLKPSDDGRFSGFI